MNTHSTANSALLVMDMQTAIVSRIPDPGPLTAKVAAAIASARAKNIPVIYVVVGFRPGMPEISASNKAFSATKQRAAANYSPEAFMAIHESVAPAPDEITVTKRRISAFAGSDLEVVLRGLDVRHLILTGIATSGVVLSTLTEAADKDFQLTVLGDACADMDEEAHRVLLTKVFTRVAEITTVQEWIK